MALPTTAKAAALLQTALPLFRCQGLGAVPGDGSQFHGNHARGRGGAGGGVLQARDPGKGGLRVIDARHVECSALLGAQAGPDGLEQLGVGEALDVVGQLLNLLYEGPGRVADPGLVEAV